LLLCYSFFLHRLCCGRSESESADVWELYDLQKDPHELNNVYAEPAYAATVTELKSELERLRKELNDHDQYVDGPPNP
jgi:hypothetical protein